MIKRIRIKCIINTGKHSKTLNIISHNGITSYFCYFCEKLIKMEVTDT